MQGTEGAGIRQSGRFTKRNTIDSGSEPFHTEIVEPQAKRALNSLRTDGEALVGAFKPPRDLGRRNRKAKSREAQ